MKYVFLGSQGSGKSTQAKLLAEKLNLPWIETGDLLRAKMNGSDEDAKEIKQAMDTGELVKNEITVKTMKERLAKADCQGGYILDGYPRNEEQLSNLDSDIEKVFFVKISTEEAIRRLALRSRSDDSGESLSKRLELYSNQTLPLLDYFKEKNILEEVNGERTIEEISKDIEGRIQNKWPVVENHGSRLIKK